ncbi:MAG: hypothetical protein IPH18_11625 [Chitinophagaceae bacterium]|nr:hypothetical protein [Chitinophagaceae bacterium]
MYVIQPNICICAAGDIYSLKLILEDFRNFCKWKSNDGNQWLTSEVVQEFFSSYDQDVLDKIVLGIAVAKDKENGFIFTPDKHKSFWQGGGSEDFGAVLAAGSGAQQYLEHISWHKQVGSSHKPGDFMYAKQVNFSFVTKFLCKENRTLKSLEDYWGGFLETCYFNGDSFEKAGNVAFVICDSETDQDGNMSIPIPRLVICSQYIDNVLYLTTVQALDFEIKQSEESICYVSKNYTKTLFAVEEIDTKNSASALTQDDNLSFATGKIALGIDVKIDSQTYLPTSAYTEGEDVKVEFVDGEYIEMIWPVHLQDKQAETIKQYYPTIKEAIDRRNSSDNTTI